ncbi:short-chain dehydrogenase [Nemania sp. NC0429]|nr:short-chain dehydrogenase [Nemania sp. NC0429]
MAHHREMARPEKWAYDELPSLEGKVAIVTGANSRDGVGYHVAFQLALKGARVYVGARSQEKADNAIKNMQEDSPSLSAAELKPLVMDLCDFRSVQRAARLVLDSEQRLDILVNNAAVLPLPGPMTLTADGISMPFATNHLGPFLFTIELLPLLTATAKLSPQSDVRIVNVGSTTHYDAPASARFASRDDFNNAFGSADDPMSAYLHYGYTKLATMLFTKELQRRFDADGTPVLVTSPHPGGVASDGAARYQGSRDTEAFRSALSPADGALTPLFAAAHPEPALERAKYAGAFLLPFGGWKEASAAARDPELAAQLWSASEALLAEVLRK